MKDFGEWFSNPARRQAPPQPVEKPAAPLEQAIDLVEDYLAEIDVQIVYRAKCRGCGERYDWVETAKDFVGNEQFYCGGSIHCTP